MPRAYELLAISYRERLRSVRRTSGLFAELAERPSAARPVANVVDRGGRCVVATKQPHQRKGVSGRASTDKRSIFATASLAQNP